MPEAVAVVELNAIHVLALSAFGVVMGDWCKRKAPILDTWNLPAAVIGGLIYAVISTALRDRFVNFEMDLVLRDILMIGFFTTIGMSASLRLLKIGGIQVVLFFLLSTVAAVLQNVLGVSVAALFGLDPLLGIMAGSVSLTGGPATALAFGADFENRFGTEGAVTLGLAVAMGGIVSGSLVAGPIGGLVIRRHNLRPEPRRNGSGSSAAEAVIYEDAGERPEPPSPFDDETVAERSPFMHTVVAIAVAMGIGSVISMILEGAGLVLPAYIGAMFAAAILRNVDDFTGWFNLSQRETDTASSISLNLFLVMALLTLRLWELVNLALPMFVILMLQVLLVWILSAGVFRAMKRDYEAAVMAGGFIGFMLGTTANAMACLEVLSAKYGPAPRAFLVVPIVGAFLIDFTNAMVITAFANFFR